MEALPQYEIKNSRKPRNNGSFMGIYSEKAIFWERSHNYDTVKMAACQVPIINFLVYVMLHRRASPYITSVLVE